MDDIRDGEHPGKNRFLAVPEGGRNHSCDRSALEGQGDIGYVPTIKKKTLQSLLYLQLRVENDQAKADGEGVVGGTASEKSAD
jgi:hypothetical protein